ncbi:ribosome-binding protein 1 [Drosophila ficusphila]|uniref:ribosome-binding protein 1 n=1 Tax=Drosophila ficusphila TaxID=30025 RepID=UPI0007E60AAE|nr:ribosome-binding protein 1 [Drosophila ficusphila]XP_017052632.1 ribosome-binding protein 1 [Drosophila ficusphila]
MDNSGNNRYELLFMDDDDSSAPVKTQIPAVVAPAKKAEAAPKAPKSKPEKENKPVASARKANNPAAKNASPVKGGKVPAGGESGRTRNPAANGANNQGRFNNNNNQRYGNKESTGEFGNELPQRHFNNRDNRGPPRARTGEKFGKREFDRQSGSDKTGVKSIDKREGGGAHNWGSPKQDIEDLKTGESSPQAEKEDSANEQSADPAAIAEEDESKQMTLDEWKALREQRAKPNWNLRKAGEGAVDNAEWKKMIVLSKKKESNSEDELEYDPSLYPQRVGRLQRIVDIQFNFNDGRKGGFRKGPRPGAGPRGEGFRGEGGYRNDGPRGEGGYRNDGPRGEGGYRNDAPRGEGNRNEGPRGEGGYRNDGPRGEGFRGQRFNNGASNGYENRQENNNRFGGEKRRSTQKPLKVDDEAQFPTLC